MTKETREALFRARPSMQKVLELPGQIDELGRQIDELTTKRAEYRDLLKHAEVACDRELDAVVREHRRGRK